jgi:hypothetical protein
MRVSRAVRLHGSRLLEVHAAVSRRAFPRTDRSSAEHSLAHGLVGADWQNGGVSSDL